MWGIPFIRVKTVSLRSTGPKPLTPITAMPCRPRVAAHAQPWLVGTGFMGRGQPQGLGAFHVPQVKACATGAQISVRALPYRLLPPLSATQPPRGVPHRVATRSPPICGSQSTSGGTRGSKGLALTNPSSPLIPPLPTGTQTPLSARAEPWPSRLSYPCEGGHPNRAPHPTQEPSTAPRRFPGRPFPVREPGLPCQPLNHGEGRRSTGLPYPAGPREACGAFPGHWSRYRRQPPKWCDRLGGSGGPDPPSRAYPSGHPKTTPWRRHS